MTDKLHCPFCGAELDKQIRLDEHYACLNTENCEFSFMVLPKKWWQALIDGKKARDALNNIVDDIDRALYANHYNDKISVRKILKDLRTSITKQEE